MSAYIILTRLRVRDQAEFDLYAQQVPNFAAGHNVKRLAGGTKFEVVEGPNVEAVFILEFPTYEEARAWYDSPLYREASKHRYLGGDFTAMIVDGVPAG